MYIEFVYKILENLCLFCQGHGQDAGNLGVLHVEGTRDSRDFCIAYNMKWAGRSLPTELDKTVNSTTSISVTAFKTCYRTQELIFVLLEKSTNAWPGHFL